MDSLKISLVIPAYNEEKNIRLCLDSVRRNGDRKFIEVIVVDNASTDGTANIAREFEFARVVREDCKGLTRARERGRLESIGGLIAYLDADCMMPENWVEIIEEVFSTRSDAVALSGPCKYVDTTRWRRLILDFLWVVFVLPAYCLVGYVLNGSNFVVKRESLAAIGGFDQTIRFYGEDTDVARRLSREGRVVFRLDFKVLASARRFVALGVLKTSATYAVNYFWTVISGRPYSSEYSDIR